MENNNIVWKDGRMLLGNSTFRLYADMQCNGELEAQNTEIALFKTKRLIQQYLQFWTQIERERINNLIELGIFHGGSVIFWNEYLRPHLHLAFDIAEHAPNSGLHDYIMKKKATQRIIAYWGVDQANVNRVDELITSTLGREPIDLIIDDASHQYLPTKVCFESLFPRLRPHGLYLIEDWSWGSWPQLAPDYPLPKGTELDTLIKEILSAMGSMSRFLRKDQDGEYVVKPLIASIMAFPDFIVVERGEAEYEAVRDFTLESYATRRP